jgi:hypothetical protein
MYIANVRVAQVLKSKFPLHTQIHVGGTRSNTTFRHWLLFRERIFSETSINSRDVDFLLLRSQETRFSAKTAILLKTVENFSEEDHLRNQVSGLIKNWLKM